MILHNAQIIGNRSIGDTLVRIVPKQLHYELISEVIVALFCGLFKFRAYNPIIKQTTVNKVTRTSLMRKTISTHSKRYNILNLFHVTSH